LLINCLAPASYNSISEESDLHRLFFAHVRVKFLSRGVVTIVIDPDCVAREDLSTLSWFSDVDLVLVRVTREWYKPFFNLLRLRWLILDLNADDLD